jgi:hypothetical protein
VLFIGEKTVAKKTAAELRAENALLKQARGSSDLALVITHGMKYACIAFIAWCAYRTIASLSGETTIAHIVINLLGSVSVSQGVAWIFGVGGTGYGVYQRKLRRDYIEKHEARVKGLEAQIDPDRSSSGLTRRGQTPKEIEK